MLERVMGRQAPPPPANVPALEPDIRGAKTIREQLDKHRHDQNCALCHAKIDPPGFALENYDVIGGWRERDRALPAAGSGSKRWIAGPAVDPSSSLGEGKGFRDIAGFKRLLLAQQEQIAAALVGKLVVYSTGASISFSDRAEIEAIVECAKPKAYGLRTLVHEVVASPLFLNK